MSTFPCPVCRRSGYITRSGIEAHLAEDHSPAVLAAELALRVFHPVAEPTSKPPAITCSKVGYPSEDEALRALLSTWRARGPRRNETRAYLCDRCPKWHLTKQPERTHA